MAGGDEKDGNRIIDIQLGNEERPLLSPEAEQERSIAVYDLIEENDFGLPGHPGPYSLVIRSEARHIHFDVRSADGAPMAGFFLAMGPLRRIIRDYRTVCDNYYDAIRTKTPSQIQAIDMGRRSLHDEGAEVLRERLDGKVLMDGATARRLFSLVCVLKSRG